eukprot:ANDGO_00918.mRNA.1 Vacuolar transporter chaperone 4
MVKFGKYLREVIEQNGEPAWDSQFVDFKYLKKLIKRVSKKHLGSEEMFADAIDHEYRKTNDHYSRVVKTLQIELTSLEKEHSDSILAFSSGAFPPENDMFNTEKSEKIRAKLRQAVMTAVRISAFGYINQTALRKALKKHDKQENARVLSPFWELQLRRTKLCPLISLEAVFWRISQLFQGLKKQEEAVEALFKDPVSSGNHKTAEADRDFSSFERKSFKFWVNPTDVPRLICRIVENLPIYCYTGFDESRGTVSQEIHSVYFDSDNFDLYQSRMEREEGASLIRIRWYGGSTPGDQYNSSSAAETTSNSAKQDKTSRNGTDGGAKPVSRYSGSTVFVEEKVHHESDVSGLESAKERFKWSDDIVVPYLLGEHLGSAEPSESWRAKNPVYADILQKAAALKIKPMVRTTYLRTAFQIPGDNSVRISLDTGMSLIRESCDMYGAREWYTDPESVRESDVYRFPYAILEVKLEKDFVKNPPAWAAELMADGDLLMSAKESGKFSKYIHGAAVLFPERVPAFPRWIIEHPDIFTIPSSPTGQVSKKRSGKESADTNGGSSPASSADQVTLWMSSDPPSLAAAGHNRHAEDDDGAQLLPGDEKIPRKSKSTTKSWFSFGKSRPPTTIATTAATARATGGASTVHIPTASGSAEQRMRSFATVPNVPAKGKKGRGAEPKTYFANERTFLSWMNAAVLLSTVGVALFNMDSSAAIGGFCFLLVAFLVLIYALYVYYQRGTAIGSMDSGFRWNDRYGPGILASSIIAAIFVSVVLGAASSGMRR